ncbi:fam-h protein [Plasmodium relictum]|uniref:Fam-h protein n=1 Tax=Plasmodium relictum TaxID=85471 RepID=A0A1J1GKH7_PLARL|nr:fam-h protein [Plasmodium relictum]CRG85287.1 fam-h protein [Plasmodium relictum]
MNRGQNVILNISLYLGYYSLVAKNFFTTDMSTLKIYNKKEKKKVLNYIMRFFMFIFLLWVSQCSDNGVSFISWNYENELKNVLNLGIKRSLTENKNMEMQAKEGSNFCEHVVVTEETLESWNKLNNIGESVDAKEGNEIEIEKKNQKVKSNERILGICKNNFKLIILSLALLLSIFSFTFAVIYMTSYNLSIHLPIFEFSIIPILIIAIFLAYEEVKIRRKNKFK